MRTIFWSTPSTSYRGRSLFFRIWATYSTSAVFCLLSAVCCLLSAWNRGSNLVLWFLVLVPIFVCAHLWLSISRFVGISSSVPLRSFIHHHSLLLFLPCRTVCSFLERRHSEIIYWTVVSCARCTVAALFWLFTFILAQSLIHSLTLVPFNQTLSWTKQQSRRSKIWTATTADLNSIKTRTFVLQSLFSSWLFWHSNLTLEVRTIHSRILSNFCRHYGTFTKSKPRCPLGHSQK